VSTAPTGTRCSLKRVKVRTRRITHLTKSCATPRKMDFRNFGRRVPVMNVGQMTDQAVLHNDLHFPAVH